ncbi:hypothetical protein IC229_16725 [Spirosoma sp. BT702]|uniref:Uncharacterized protein n=1 Tax=Spirosoma profusum TaxID=2771354 RepID=A0A927ANP9_9BACT|nr:hypothetical protein [Spirosoma profusum]MBD2702299.1 hypothetical protein [Spirosoma profusum]
MPSGFGPNSLIGSPFVSQSVLTYSPSKTAMLSVWIASQKNNLSFRYSLLKRRASRFDWSRQLAIQLTVILVGLFYTCSALELDLGETGDGFGDVYDTYVPSTPVQTPKPTESVYRKIKPAQAVIVSDKHPLVCSVEWSFALVLVPLALYIYKPPKRRRLQVLHAIWRL